MQEAVCSPPAKGVHSLNEHERLSISCVSKPPAAAEAAPSTSRGRDAALIALLDGLRGGLAQLSGRNNAESLTEALHSIICTRWPAQGEANALRNSWIVSRIALAEYLSGRVHNICAERHCRVRSWLQAMPAGTARRGICMSWSLTEKSRHAQLYVCISRLSVLLTLKNTEAMTVFTKGSGS